ncbi:Ig kappa chain V-III region PC 2485/PC 4039 [Oreochromis niloticus]|uniref:Ig kappa chain V-III region PC 2485/PC 4039 n=1 Tax=Oreochromis niloticus TaxID=8128 RepID=UPI003D80F666
MLLSSFLSQLMMESLLVWVILLALSGLQNHAAVDPSSTIQVRLGENATLQCPLLDTSNFTVLTTTTAPTAPTTLSWYRKAPGQGPQLLVSLKSMDRLKVKYGNGVPRSKVSIAADGSLVVQGSKQSDSAVYYCGISRGDDRKKEPRLRTRRRK